MRFKPIKPKKISAQIAEQIRNSILAGDFSPGDKLPPERELAEMFGVSRPSVREGINALASTGLVVSYQGGGTVVRSLIDNTDENALSGLIRDDEDRALDVIEVRKCMESWTAYYAAKRAQPEDRVRLEEMLAAMEEHLGEIAPSEELDVSFHLVIAKATHNVVWLHLMQSIVDAMSNFQRSVWRAVYLTIEDQTILFEHHKRIVNAILDRNAQEAQTAMMEHLSFAEQRSTLYVNRLNTEDQQ
ncbi:MAG: FadR/GntR family transcriptional regulator [Desulfobulbus sp.]|jgi:GntR family transcriptional repressor for pyruvate dehydrogenase complex